MLNLKQVMEKTGYSKGHIYHRINRGTFPASQLVKGRAVWDEAEIQPYLEKRRLVIEIDGPTGLAIDETARLCSQDIPGLVSTLIIEAIKNRTANNPLYPIDWREVEERQGGLLLKDYLRFYNDWIKAIRGSGNHRFDIRQGKTLLRCQSVLPMAQRESMGVSQMEALQFKVVNVYEDSK